MGSWKLEIVRKLIKLIIFGRLSLIYSGMACYISFPLAAMFLFSRPEFFKERVIADRKRYYPPPNPERVNQLLFFKNDVEDFD